MAVRYTQQLTSEADDVYRVDIIDGDFVGSSSEFILADFETDWKGQQNDRANFLIGSSCTVITRSTTTSNLDTLISDIIGAEEGRFTIAIYKKVGAGAGSFQLWWWGLVLNDLSSGTDETPTQYSITATDGLGILKGVDYQNSGLPVATQTSAETLATALQNIPYNSFFAASDEFLNTRVNWYESEMTAATGDPLNLTQIPASAFYDVDSDGNYTFKNCYEVIQTVCNLFKARLFFANGVWRFYQIYDLENESNFNYYRYQYNKTQTAGTPNLILRQTLTGGFSGGTRLATQTFENFAPLRKVTQKYLHDTSDNLIKGITFDDTTALTQVVTSVDANGSANFAFTATLQTTLTETTPAGVYVTTYVKSRLTIKVGSYYLVRPVANQVTNNDYTNLTWSLTAGYVEFISVQNVNQYGGNNIAINFNTPAIPSSSAVSIQLEKIYVQDLQQNDISSNYTTSVVLQNPYLEYVDGDGENERIYSTTNSTTAFFSDTLKFPDINTADRINPLTPNNLRVWDGAAWVESTGKWGRNTVLGTNQIISLGIEEFIAGQRTAVKKRQGDFVGQFEIYNVLGVSSEFYLFLGVQYFANSARFSGEWYKIGTYDATGLTTTATGIPLNVTNLPDAPSVSAPQTSGTANLPTGVEMDNGKIEIIDNSGTRKIVLNSNDFNYILNNLVLGSDTKESTAIFQISSTTQGFLPPKMTATQKNNIESPAEGLIIYQTDATSGLYLYNGSTWELV